MNIKIDESQLEAMVLRVLNNKMDYVGNSNLGCLTEDLVEDTSNYPYISQFRIGNYGVADLVRIDNDAVACSYPRPVPFTTSVDIWELKRDSVGPKALFQALRYAKGIRQSLCAINMIDKEYTDISFHIHLLGSSIEGGDWRLGVSFFEAFNLSLYEYSFTENGLCVKYSNLDNTVLVEEGDLPSQKLLDSMESICSII